MHLLDLVKEAERQLSVCNACRYCEGLCDVWPAMARRKSFEARDVMFLANLCFDCRDCYYVCPYSEPHEFAVNPPKIFAELRSETYRQYTPPQIISRLLKSGAWAVSLAVVLCVAAVLLLVLRMHGASGLTSAPSGLGSFYTIIPLATMTVAGSALSLYAAGVLFWGFIKFWRDTHGTLGSLLDPRAFWAATRDAFTLKNMKGGGLDCSYPAEEPTTGRRWFHHLVFYGFLLDLASTMTAGVYTHVFDWEAPYPLFSVPVILGTAGGVMLMIGTIGLLVMKSKSNRSLEHQPMRVMDVAFLVLLFLTSASGLALLALRESASMGLLLTVHLGVVAALFVTLPYGKFAHVVFRYSALLQNSMERQAKR